MIDVCVQWNPIDNRKDPRLKAVLESGTTGSAGQYLHHRATGVPLSVRRLDMDGNTV